MDLGEFIKKKRLEKNLTLEQLGDKIGKPKNFISRIENGKVKSLKDDTIKKISEALDIPIIEFFAGYDENGIRKSDKMELQEITASEFKEEVLHLLDKAVMNEMDKGYFIQTLNMICDKEDKDEK